MMRANDSTFGSNEEANLASLDLVKISVDGEDGDIVARHFRSEINDDFALIRYSESRDGKHGVHASQATPGAPAGKLAVELYESTEIEEGVYVKVVGFTSRQEPPESVHVQARKNFILSAAGGKGQGGHTGGDGQAGLNGINGRNATREVDATDGTDGGNGGDAGLGSNGADGGCGGNIEIFVDEDDTHLLFAAQFNVRGGDEGGSGHHGKPGEEGLGGSGGEGHSWRELVGYQPQCTSSCIGDGGRSASTSLVRAGSVISTRSTALIGAFRAQAVQGTNLQAMIASVAQRYGATRHPTIPNDGSCHCKGGRGSCAGCKPVPMHQQFNRRPGRKGRDGRPGIVQTTLLHAGLPGNDGSVKINVSYHDGSTQQYESLYRLELVDFDVEDENGDGIFEPGEHVLVRRIRIRNTGGMPSPTRGITIYVAASEYFAPVAGQDGKAVTHGSIEPGITVTLNSFFRILIREIKEPIPMGARLKKRANIAIMAKMPWLNRNIPHFDYTRNIDIQYPVEVRQFDYLPTMALRSVSRFSLEVHNKSTRALGGSSKNGRQIELQMSFPTNCGSLQSQEREWLNTIECQVLRVSAQEAITVRQSIRITDNAEISGGTAIVVALYLSLPNDTVESNAAIESNKPELQLVECFQLPIQLSAQHTYNPASSFLLITNSKCSRQRIQAIQNFINDGLQMQSDEWNCSLYGGLQYRPDFDDEVPDSVLAQYGGKSIIFLGNAFQFFEPGDCNIHDLCDPSLLAEVCLRGSRCLFLESSDHEQFKSWLESWTFPISQNFRTASEPPKASQRFNSLSSLYESISQKIDVGRTSTNIVVYTLSLKHSWYRTANSNTMVAAKQVKKYLGHRLPQERFQVVASGSGGEQGSKESHVTILHGLPHSTDITATEVQAKGSEFTPFEAYMIADALPTSLAYDALSSLPTQSTVEMISLVHSPSLYAYRAVHLALLRRLITEIQLFHRRFSRQHAMDIPTKESSSEKSLQAFIRIHFPTLSYAISSYTARSQPAEFSNKHFQNLLVYALASCLPRKRHRVSGTFDTPRLSQKTALRTCFSLVIKRFVILHIIDNKNVNHHDQNEIFHAIEDYVAKAENVRFFHDDKKIHDMGKIITSLLAEFTQMSVHEFEHGQVSARDVAPKTKVCTVQEWDDKFEQEERRRRRIRERTENAWNFIGSMTMGNELDGARGI